MKLARLKKQAAEWFADPMFEFGIATLALAVMVTLALAGCASAPAATSAQLIQTVAKPVCIPVRAWTAAEQRALDDALAPIPESSPIVEMAKDWERMRAAARAACPEAKP